MYIAFANGGVIEVERFLDGENLRAPLEGLKTFMSGSLSRTQRPDDASDSKVVDRSGGGFSLRYFALPRMKQSP